MAAVEVNQKVASAQGEFVKTSPLDYQNVAASQTDKILGSLTAVTDERAIGDLLQRLVITVATAANSAVSIQDGDDTAFSILPAAVGGGVGVYMVELGIRSRVGPWSVTTGSGVTVTAIGLFT
jgi:hypothetical protein